MTTDGAANERGAAVRIVNEGNDLHCAAHLIQLVINDQLDSKKSNPPPFLARHRRIVDKAHRLVVYINGHRATFQAFSVLAKSKATEEGTRMFVALVVDVETRWDSELALLERLVYFDTEILSLCLNPNLGIDPEMMLDRFEFDLAYAMTLVLQPFRIITKFVQYRDKVTLAYLPGYLDRLVSQLAPNSFNALLGGRSAGVLPAIGDFQASLVESLRERFAWVFEDHSLPLAASYLLPGHDRLNFVNFAVNEETIEGVKENMLDDLVELLPPEMPAPRKAALRALASATLTWARTSLNDADDHVDPLLWWPQQAELGPLFPIAKMLFAIPASTADDERTFSGAGFVLNARRTRLDIDNFRREHRTRQFLTEGTSLNAAVGRQLRLQRAQTLLIGLNRLIAQREAQQPAPAEGEHHD